MVDLSFHGKPSNWNSLPLYQKIKFTMSQFDERFSTYVHKLQAKKIAEQICGDSIKVPKTVRILKNPDDITEKDLNTKYLIKGAHGCDFNINIKPNKNYDLGEVKQKIHSFNKKYNAGCEKQYSYLNPLFFIEEKIEDKIYGKTGDAVCYLLRCIHGVPYTFTVREKHTNKISNYLFKKDKSLKEIPNLDKTTPSKVHLDQVGKKNIENMYNLACKLSKNFEFVRIDFYLDKNDDIYFSEFTLSPAAGGKRFPIELENELGKLWK